MLRGLRHLPFFKVLAIAQVALLVRRHLKRLTLAEHRRLAALVRRGPTMSKEERRELYELVSKLEPGAFALAATDRLAPFPVGRVARRFGGRKGRR